MKRSFIFLIALLLFSFISGIQAQDVQTAKLDVVPASPEVASFKNKAMTSESLSEGKSNISVPLYNLSGRDISVPVSVEYSTGGLRVAERATSVGLGWTLNAGGAISRQLHGKPDESADGLFNKYAYWKSNIKNYHHNYNLDPYLQNTEATFMLDVAVGRIDLDPDEFYFNFSGYSGKIVFDKTDNQPKIFPPQNLKIDLYKNNGSNMLDDTWLITDGNGTKYYFEVIEKATYPSQNSSNYFISTWHLSKIESQSSKEKMIFEYDHQSVPYTEPLTPLAASMYYCDYTHQVGYVPVPGETRVIPIQMYQPYVPSENTSYDLYLLKKISYQLNSAEIISLNFRYEADRQDVYQTSSYSRLTNIGATNQGTDFLTILFDNNHYFSSGSTYKEKRMRLDNISINDEVYHFDYSGLAMPSYQSLATDHWGYYNGKANTDDIPKIEKDYIQQSYPSCAGLFNSNKEPDLTNAQAGILTAVTFPTKSKVSFEYELNSAMMVSDVQYTKSVTANGGIGNTDGSSAAQSIRAEFANGDQDLPAGAPNVRLSSVWQFAKPTNVVKVNAYYNGSGYPPNYPTRVRVYEVIQIGSSIGLVDLIAEYENFPGEYYLYHSFDPAKKYCLVALMPEGMPSGVSLQATLSYTESELKERKIGGLRLLKKTTLSGQTTRTDNYTYKENFEPNSPSPNEIKTSGVLKYDPNYIYPLAQGYVFTSFGVTGDGNRQIQNGYHICYKEVQVNTNNEILASTKFSTSDYIYMRGKALESRSFKKTGVTYALQSKVTSQYVEDVSQNVYGYPRVIVNANQYYLTVPPGVIPIPNPHGYLIKYEDEGIGEHWIRLVNTQTLSYENGGTPIETNTAYTYTTIDKHVNPVTITTTGPNSMTRTLSVKYAHEASQSDMLIAHMTGVPLEVLRDAGTGGGSKVTYKSNWTNCSGCVLPEKFYSYGTHTGGCNDGDWTLNTTVKDVNAGGYPTKVLEFCNSADADAVYFQWINGLLTSKQYKDRTWQFDWNYFTHRQMKSATDFDGQSTYFEYDNNLRLKTTKARAEKIKSENTYAYASGVGQKNTLTNVQTYATDASFNGVQLTTNSYFDGLGQLLETDMPGFLDGGGLLHTSAGYDALGRVISQNNPLKAQGSDICTYESAPSSRPLTVTPAGSNIAISYQYTINSASKISPLLGALPANTYYVTEATNEHGNKHTEWKDIFGRTVHTFLMDGINLSLSDKMEMWYKYNARDQVTDVENSVGQRYQYSYYSDGMLQTRRLPGNYVWTYYYDTKGRLWKEDHPDGYSITTVYNDYDQPTQTTVGNAGTIVYTYNTTPGVKLGKLKYKDVPVIGNGQTMHYTYDYDQYGRLISENETTIDGGTTARTISYANHKDLPYMVNAEINFSGTNTKIYNTYGYDASGRLKNTALGFLYNTVGFSYKKISDLTYNGNNWLSIKSLNDGLQTINYGYHPRGWLKNINGVGGTGDELPATCNAPTVIYPCEAISAEPKVEVGFEKVNINTNGKGFVKINAKMNQYDNNVLIGTIDTTTVKYIGGSAGSLTPPSPYPSSALVSEPAMIVNNINRDTMVGLLTDQVMTAMTSNGLSNAAAINEIRGAVTDLLIKASSRPCGPPDNPSGPDNNPLGSALFGEELYYETSGSYINGPSQYNGNISQVLWQTKGHAVQAYGFKYDNADRIREAKYADVTKDGGYTQDNKYGENLVYANTIGDISTLDRRGYTRSDLCGGKPSFGPVDQLSYAYSGDQARKLLSLTDASQSTKIFKPSSTGYSYEAATGRLTDDSGNGLHIEYSCIDLPMRVTSPTGVMTYYYDAEGRLLQKAFKRASDGQTDRYTYLQGMIYKNGIMQTYDHAEGQLTWEGNLVHAQWHLRDHLGSTRVVFEDMDGNKAISANEILQTASYYPFGAKHEQPEMPAPQGLNRYKYNGKEEQQESRIDFYDYGARLYDAQTGRWNAIDHFAQKYSGLTPYNYAANNPIKYIDINGDSIIIKIDSKNRAIYKDGNLCQLDGKTQYEGKGVVTKKDGSRKLKGFLKKVVNDLDKIRGGGETGSNLITALQSSDKKITIKEGNENASVGYNIKYDPNSTQSGFDENGNKYRPSYIGLAHELIHTYDWLDGVIDAGTWITYSDGKTSINAEKYVSHVENLIRAENKLPLRAYYGTDNGQGVGELIIPGTRMSTNFYMNVGGFTTFPYIYP